MSFPTLYHPYERGSCGDGGGFGPATHQEAQCRADIDRVCDGICAWCVRGRTLGLLYVVRDTHIKIKACFGLCFVFAAVDWSERWLWALAAFHVVLLVLVVLSRHQWTSQVTLLTLIRTSLHCWLVVFDRGIVGQRTSWCARAISLP